MLHHHQTIRTRSTVFVAAATIFADSIVIADEESADNIRPWAGPRRRGSAGSRCCFEALVVTYAAFVVDS